METRILIPKGLRVVVVEKGARKTGGGGGGRGGGNGAETVEENDKDEEEKPSSSSGYFETGSCKRRPRTRSASKLIEDEAGENSSSNDNEEVDDDRRKFSEFATSSTGSSSTPTPSSGNEASDFSEQEIIGSSSVEKERKRRRKRRNPGTVNKEKNFYSGVKICADRVIEKGTVFTANEGDVQVINLQEVPAIPKEDVRFLFGGFETITPIPGGSTPSPPPQISGSSATYPATDSTSTPTPANSTSCNLIRLCNWIRFLRRGGGGSGRKTPKTSSATTTFPISHSDDENSHQSDPDFSSNINNNNRNECFLTKKPTSKEMNDSHYHNLVDRCESNNINIIGRILDGRPIFEVTQRLVPGTELLVDFHFQNLSKTKTSNMDFHLMDILTQQQNPQLIPISSASSSPSTFPTSPFFSAMMIPRNIQMMMAAGTPSLALNNMNINLNSSSAAAAAFLLNSSTSTSTPTSTSTFDPFLSPDYFNLKRYMGGFDHLHYGSENENAENENSLTKKRENDEKRQFFPLYQHHHPQNHFHPHHHHPNVHLNPSTFAFNFYSPTQPSLYENCRSGEKGEVKIKQEKGDSFLNSAVGAGGFLDAPLDLSKLHEAAANAEPLLKVGTPFDSPDSNEDEDLKGFRIKQEPLGKSKAVGNSGSCGSSTLFSIRNVLKNQLSPPPSAKLFQPYGADIGIGKDFRGNVRLAGTTSTPTTAAALSSASASTTTTSSITITQRPILRTRGRERSLLPCEVCGKAFDRPSLLKRHLRTHTGEKPHICDVCSKGFSTSSSLNTHRRIHSGEKPHQCPICGKRFTASSNLYYHRMTHNKEKPHKCLLCGKSFPTPGDLKSHQYVHSGSWPYSCPVCQRGFSKQTNLRNHLLLHSSGGGGSGAAIGLTLTTSSIMPVEKSHVCGVCDKKFTLACNLRTHMRTHQHYLAVPDSESHGSNSSKCLNCKQPVQTVFNGHCQDCYLSKRRQRNEMTPAPSPMGKNSTPPHPHPHPPPASSSSSQSEKKMGNIFQSQSHLECHSSSKGNSSSPPALSGTIPSLTMPQPLTTLPLPQLSGFGFPGIPGAGAAASGMWNPTNLFNTNTIRGRESSGNPLLEQLLEWNLRFAKETAGMNIMQQKLLESQVFAAQLMSTHGFGLGVPGSGGSALQEVLRRSAAAATDGISHQLNGVGVGIASNENKFMQH